MSTDTDRTPYTVRKNFKDGNLADDFKKLGYGSTWIAGRVRYLPRWLARRAELSGALLAVPDEKMIEDQIPPATTPPAYASDEEAEQMAAARIKGEPRMRIMFIANWSDGNLASDLAAAGHPATFKANEIVELPVSVVQKMIASGAKFTTNGEEMALEEKYQLKHQVRIQEWQRAREQAKAEQLESAKYAEHNKRIHAEIDKLSARFLKAAGKARDAIAAQLEELWSQIK